MMDTKTFGDYRVEDFVTDESFANYHFCLNSVDQQSWERWILKHPEKAAIVEEAESILDMLSLTLSRTEYKEELKQIRETITIDSLPAKKKTISFVRFLNWDKHSGEVKDKLVMITAVLLPVLLLLIIGKYFSADSLDRKESSLVIRHNNENKPTVFALDDGTVITLAANSSLKYPMKFKEKERKVYLEGEAQFQVSKDKYHPFKVYQDNIIATVLGTTFTIKKQVNDAVISVELITGSLRVDALSSSGSLSQSVVLEPNQRAVYALRDQSLTKETWKQNNEKKIVNNHLVFKQNAFEEISATFKEVYGITLINQSSKKDWRFTGEFTNSSAKEIVKSICLIKKLDMEVRGDTLLIKNARSIK